MKKWIVGGSVVASMFLAVAAFATTSSELLPVGDGAYRDWFSSGAGAGYTNVDDTPCNATTDYNYATSTNAVVNRENYRVSLASVPDGSTINQIAIIPCASAHTTGSSVLDVFYRYNGGNSTYLGSYALSGTTPIMLATSTWSGLSLSKDSASTLDIGVRLTSGSAGARISRISTVLGY